MRNNLLRKFALILRLTEHNDTAILKIEKRGKQGWNLKTK